MMLLTCVAMGMRRSIDIDDLLAGLRCGVAREAKKELGEIRKTAIV
jgi:hypothetical protein